MAAANRRPEHATCLAQGPEAVLIAGQVVQRAEQEYDVRRGVGLAEGTGIAQGGGYAGVPASRLLDVEGHRINQADAMALAGQPLGVDTGPSADVEDIERAGRDIPEDELLG